MKTILALLCVVAFIAAFCGLLWLIEKGMNKVRRKRARRIIMRRHPDKYHAAA